MFRITLGNQGIYLPDMSKIQHLDYLIKEYKKSQHMPVRRTVVVEAHFTNSRTVTWTIDELSETESQIHELFKIAIGKAMQAYQIQKESL